MRSVRFRSSVLAAVVAVAALAAPSQAAPGDVAAEAKKLAAAGDVAGAVKLSAGAAAAAQKAGDLLAEQNAAKVLAEIFERHAVEDVPAKPGATGATSAPSAAKPTVSSLLVVALAQLDPKRDAAFVSAAPLARRILEAATRTGDRTHVGAAADALEAWAKTARRDQASAVLFRYAEGMRAVAAGDAAKAVEPLAAAFQGARTAGWLGLVAATGVELAATRVAAGDVAGAAAAVKETGAAFSNSDDMIARVEFGTLVRTRFPDPAGELKAAIEALPEPTGGGQAGGSGGRGGRGGDGGESSTAAGKLLKKGGATAMLVSAKRTGYGLEVRTCRDPADTAKVELTSGLVVWEDQSGFELFVHRDGVALAQVDPEGGAGGLGGRTHEPPTMAFHLLAPGETWTVTAKGAVKITAAK